ncbi:MAG TPA: DUF5317 domain-containing protein [Roseiflexaceae bacterium]|nr:DUF5317 domain-containing protein [Roseiflexaceae bacterium]
MLRALIVITVIAVALVRGGSLERFATLRVRLLPLALGAFALQLLIFTPFLGAPLVGAATTALYVLSMALLVVWVAFNRHLPGIALMAAGVVLNTAAIVANGGYMPLWLPAAQIAGTIELLPASGPAVHNNSVAAGTGTQLWLLTDILPVPGWVPFATVYSIGDVLLTLGVCILCWQTMRGRAGVPVTNVNMGGTGTA